MNDMGVIATNNNEIRFLYNSESSTGKQALGYVKAADREVLEIDVIKTKVTATQWAELADKMNKKISELIDKKHPDFVNEYGEGVSLDDANAWAKLLENQPQVLTNPILLSENFCVQIDSPSDVSKHLNVDSAGIPKK